MLDLGISGKSAIVAGASTGMGWESAMALAKAGVHVYMSARSEERLLSAADEIRRASGGSVMPVVADHSTQEGRQALLAACPEPDILVVTCSPPSFVESYQDIEVDTWEAAIATAFIGPVELMRATLDGMKKRGFGRVVNIATIAAKTGNDARLLSGVPRAALCNYTAAIARPLSKFNIAINSILPGMFDTPGVHKVFKERAEKNGTSYEAEVDKWYEKLEVPAGRFGNPRDVGALCAFLCSQYAGYVVGQSVVIDGGRVRSVF